MSIDPIDTLPKMLTRRTEPPHERALQPPPRPTAPYLLIGLVSAFIGRRDAIRCTWLRALRSGPHAGAARVLFVVGNGAEDAGRPDVLLIALDEQRRSKQSGSRRVRGTVATYSTYSLYAKTMHFVRYASTQLEPAIALADDDVFVQPHALLTYAWTLLHSPSLAGRDAWYAGRFDYYSWRTERMMATAYWRSMRGALFGAQASYRNCSPTGAGWLPKPNGKGVDREATSASPGQERCVGPFAFTKGPLVMLSAPVVRWLVRSERFQSDTARAARLAGVNAGVGAVVSITDERGSTGGESSGVSGAGADASAEGGSSVGGGGSKRAAHALERVPQDVNLGYWLSAHPTLRYVALPKYLAWADAYVEVCDLRRLLIAHRVPWDQLAWLTGRTERLWRRAPYVHMRLQCGGPPCPPGQCAHARGQLACALDLQLPPLSAYDNAANGGGIPDMGCTKCECWEGKGAHRSSSGGRCNFTRLYEPKLPEHCWDGQMRRRDAPRHAGAPADSRQRS